MRNRWLLVVALLGGLARAGAEVPTDAFASAYREWSGRTIELDAEVAQVCRSRAEALAASGWLRHDENGRGPAVQMLDAGFPTGEWAEILGAGPDWPSIFRGWLASDSHRAVLAEAGWRRVGWGSSRRGETLVVVVRFWRP